MKKYISALLLSTLILSCGAPDQQAELEKLRAQRAELDLRIAELESSSGADTTAGKTLEVAATAVQPETFKSYIEIQAKVDAEENVSLSTESPGTITKILVKQGDKVSAGQVLAETDAKAVSQQLAAAQTQYQLAKQVYERQKNLWDQKIGSEIQFLQEQARKDAAEAQMNLMNEQIRMTKIISPINGTVDNVNIKIGQAVAPGLSAISVVNFSKLSVKADVAESYAGRVKNGNEVLVVFPDLRDSIESKVIHASRAIDPMTRTFKVEVALDNKKEYQPNLVARIRINDYISPEPVIVLPVKFIQRGMNENYVFLSENNKVIKRNISIGREYNGRAEITSGIKAGDLVITEGYDMVDEGDIIRIRK